MHSRRNAAVTASQLLAPDGHDESPVDYFDGAMVRKGPTRQPAHSVPTLVRATLTKRDVTGTT